MVVAIVLLPWYSFFALMIADSVKHLIHTGVSAWLLRRGLGGYGDQRLTGTAVKTSLAAAGMGVLAFGTASLLEYGLPEGLLARIVIVGGAGGIGVVAFGALASLLGLEEWRWIRGLLRQRIGL
jgi:peptidoglycan biosynthesis protein MviN/MurJ (putative lipid II flippase)